MEEAYPPKSYLVEYDIPSGVGGYSVQSIVG